MSEIPKAYEPQSVESKWYRFWLDQECFVADPAFEQAALLDRHSAAECDRRADDGPCAEQHHSGYPGAQGADGRQGGALAARHRSRRHRHADGRREGCCKKEREIKHRDDLGREEFLEQRLGVEGEARRHHHPAVEDARGFVRLVAQRFTMDPAYSRCVQNVFVDLYKKGLIYRGKRMVNWCPASQTALSDEEVIMKEQKGLHVLFQGGSGRSSLARS